MPVSTTATIAPLPGANDAGYLVQPSTAQIRDSAHCAENDGSLGGSSAFVNVALGSA
jgi:hypothetical protein